MQKFIDFMERYFVPLAAKIGSQRHLVAIRDGFASIMGLMIVGSFGLLIKNFPVQAVSDLMAEGQPLEYLKVVSLNIYGGSMFLMGLFAALGIGYALGKSYEGVDGLSTALTCLASSLVLMNMFDYAQPITWGGEKLSGWEPGLASLYLGPTGLITILISTLFFGTIFAKLSQNKHLIIKMPEGVPPAVSRAFAALLPTCITLVVAGVIFAIFVASGNRDIYKLIYTTIQKPLMGFSNSLPVLLLLILVQQMLWFFGLHGSNILAPVINGIFLALTAENMAAIASGSTEGINIINSQFLDSYVNMGGSGVGAAIVIALFIRSKSALNKTIRNVASGPALFNINEPVIFGLPIVLNPLYIVPFILAPMISACIAYALSAIHFVAPAVNIVPWTTPPIFAAALATGSWQGGATAAICLAVSVLVYLPFIAYADKKELENEMATSEGGIAQ